VVARLQRSNSYRSAPEVGNAVDAVLGEQLETPDVHAGEHCNLLAAVKLHNHWTGEVLSEVDASGGDRLVQDRSDVGDDILDFGDAVGC
jgi:hypothetical protein